MRVCIVTPIFPPQIGGPATYVSELAEQLHKDMHEVKVITLGKEVPKGLGYEVHVVRRHDLLLREISLFKRILEHARDCDLIYAQGIAAIGMPCVLAGKLLGKKVVVKYVGDSAWEKALREGKTGKSLEEFLARPDALKWMLKLQRQVLHSAHLIIAPSMYLKHILRKYYHVGEDRIKVVYNSVEIPKVRRRALRKTKAIVTVGRLVPWKHVDQVIRAFEIVRKKEKGAELKIIGDGPLMGELEGLAKSLGLAGSVEFCGRKSHRETIESLANSDIFVLFSSYEGMSHVLLEAMACRTPVVASDIMPNEELLKNDCGVLSKSNDFKELARNILELLADRKKAAKLTANAYGKVTEEHDRMKKYQEIVAILQDVGKE